MNKLKKLGLVAASMLLVLQLPLVALADDAAPTDTMPAATTTTTPTDPTSTSTPAPSDTSTPAGSTTTAPTDTTPTTSTPGPTTPTGADSSQYTYNPDTGLWESANYTWDPVTKQTAPKNDPGYYYDPATKTWSTTEYVYHPESGKYEPASVPVAAPVSTLSGLGGATDLSANPLLALAALLGGDPAISGTGPNSTNSIVESNNNNGFFDLFSKAAIQNNLNSTAVTGDASVSGNTTGGSATSGPAQVMANLFNLINSAYSWASGGLSTFVANLMGSQNGNVLLQPSTATGGGGCLGCLPTSSGTVASNTGTGPNSTNTIDANNNNGLTVNSQQSGTINNNVNALAQSGNAGVTGNTTGGNATSGNATVDVNIMNLINSAIGAGQSFFGVVNIFGSLTGDILFPQGFLDSIASTGGTCSICSTSSGPTTASNSNTGPGSLNTIGANSTNNTNISSADTSAINNNLNTAAQSGSANVSGNTTGGSATTGSATTNSNVFNFAGDLSSDNAVLVLVNVLGTWVGAILNMPSTGGSQAALLTGGPSTLSNSNTGPSSTNTIDANNTNNTNISSANTNTINNNINAGAISGNADVSHNTTGGNATSGDASVATNVANFVGSTINVKHWFGVLVVNVFGDWFGNVGSATPKSAALQTTNADGSGSNQSATQATVHTNKAGSNSTAGGSNTISGSSQGSSSNISSGGNKVKLLGSHERAAAASTNHGVAILAIVIAALMLLAGMMAGLDRKLGHRA